MDMVLLLQRKTSKVIRETMVLAFSGCQRLLEIGVIGQLPGQRALISGWIWLEFSYRPSHERVWFD
jgi:hypothetical protein